MCARARVCVHVRDKTHMYDVHAIHYMQFAWACGTIMEALLAFAVMTNFTKHGWRWLLGFSALPLGLLLLIIPVSIFT